MTTFSMSNIQKAESIAETTTSNPVKGLTDEQKIDHSEEDNQEEKKPENSSFFQAITTLYGEVKQDSDLGFYIKIGANKYRLFVFPAKYRGWLKQVENQPNTPLYLRVYPKYQIIARKPPQIYFQVVAWAEENQWSEPNIYIFRGIWQFVPQVKTPVISVYRNRGSKDYTDKYKASHLPVLMRREDEASPFRFNPKIAKEDLPPKWFIQAKFKFIPSKNCWGWLEDIEPPTQEIPGYKRPKKQDLSPKKEDDLISE